MTYTDNLLLSGGFVILFFGICFSIYLYKNEKSGMWDEIVKDKRTLFIISVILLICGYIGAIYGMNNFALSILGAGLILLSVYFLMVAIFYKPNSGEIKKAKASQE